MSTTADAFLELVQATPNTPQGATRIVKHGLITLHALDFEIAELFAKRQFVRDILVQFAQLERILAEGEPLTPDEIEEIAGPPTTLTGDRVGQAVLQIASESSDPVTVEFIADKLQKRFWGQTLPWSNPRAAIGTILYQSGDWERVERGVYRRKTYAATSDDLISPEDLPF